MARMTLEAFIEEIDGSDTPAEVLNDNTEVEIAAGEFSATNNEVIGDLGEIETALENLQNIAEMSQALLNKETISTEEYTQFKRFAMLSFESFATDTDKFAVSLEGITDTRLAVEGILDKAAGFVKQVASTLWFTIKAVIDNYQYVLSIFTFQKKKMQELKTAIKKCGKDTVTLEVSASSYLCFGDNAAIVKDAGEYLKKLQEATSVLTKMLDVVGTYTTKDFLNSVRTLFLVLSNEKFKESFVNLEKLVDGITSIKGIRKDTETGGRIYYTSETYLGNFRVTATKPKDSYDKKDPASLKKQGKHFSVLAYRYGKFAFNRGTVTFASVDAKYIEKLIDAGIELADAYIKFNTVINRLSALGTSIIPADIAQRMASGNLVVIALPWFFANYRIMVQGCLIITALTGTTANVSRGHLTKVGSVAEQFIKKVGS